MMLPIGSIVYLKNGYEKLIIVQRIIDFNIDEALYYMEYAGVLYPDGNEPFYFNEENIDKVVFKGYSDEENERFESAYLHWKNENPERLMSVEKMSKLFEEKKAQEIEKTNEKKSNSLIESLFGTN